MWPLSLGLGPGGQGVGRAGGSGAGRAERPGARGPEWRRPPSCARRRAARPLRPRSGASAAASELRLGWPGGPRGTGECEGGRAGPARGCCGAPGRAGAASHRGDGETDGVLETKTLPTFYGGMAAPSPIPKAVPPPVEDATTPALLGPCCCPPKALWDRASGVPASRRAQAGPRVAQGWRRLGLGISCGVWAPDAHRCHAGPRALPGGVVTLGHSIPVFAPRAAAAAAAASRRRSGPGAHVSSQ